MCYPGQILADKCAHQALVRYAVVSDIPSTIRPLASVDRDQTEGTICRQLIVLDMPWRYGFPRLTGDKLVERLFDAMRFTHAESIRHAPPVCKSRRRVECYWPSWYVKQAQHLRSLASIAHCRRVAQTPGGGVHKERRNVHTSSVPCPRYGTVFSSETDEKQIIKICSSCENLYQNPLTLSYGYGNVA